MNWEDNKKELGALRDIINDFDGDKQELFADIIKWAENI